MTEQEQHEDIKKEANDLSENAMDIEKLQYSANDFNDFSALTAQKAQENYEQNMPKVEEKKKLDEQPRHKDFFEELYDRQHIKE